MSFILDALKKSEAERQRQTGPTLLELRITRPRRRYPLWTWLVGALLAANAAVLLTFVLRRPAAVPAPAPSTTVSATPAATTKLPVVAAAAPLAAARVGQATAAAPGQATVSPSQLQPLAARPLPGANTSGGGTLVTPDGASTADDASGGAARNPADYEPALPAGSQPQPPPSGSARSGLPVTPAAPAADYSSLPSISQLGGNIPSMQLDLLDYSELSSERYALINMHRVREGDALPDGAKVLAITPNGVAMDYRGQQFLLRPGGTAQ